MPVKRRVAKARRLERPVAKRGQYSWAPDGPPAGCILDADLAERAGFYVLIAHSNLNESSLHKSGIPGVISVW